MNNFNLKIEYIYHSCFSIETDKYQLVFDYYKGDLKLNPNKNLVFFSSHSHEDHFNKDILNMKAYAYVLSNDITIGNNYRDNIYFMAEYENLKIDDISIKSFSSTDLGLSFLISIDGINICHTGDLNWWYWKNDTDTEKAMMEKDFKEEVNKISENRVDILFAPVDPRLEENYFLAGKYYLEKLKPKVFFPMHFGDNYSKIKPFINNMNTFNTHIVNIEFKNQIFNI